MAEKQNKLVDIQEARALSEQIQKILIQDASRIAESLVEDISNPKGEKFELRYQALLMRATGMSNAQIAKEMGVDQKTIYRWIGNHTDGALGDKDPVVQKIQEIIIRDSTLLLSTVSQAALLRIVSLMYSGNEKVALDASKDLLDRIGLKAANKLEFSTSSAGEILIKFGSPEQEEWAK